MTQRKVGCEIGWVSNQIEKERELEDTCMWVEALYWFRVASNQTSLSAKVRDYQISFNLLQCMPRGTQWHIHDKIMATARVFRSKARLQN